MARTTWGAILALLLLLAIGSDLAGDSDCDLLPASDAVELASTPPSGAGAESCAQACLPDCYCCSPSVLAQAPVVKAFELSGSALEAAAASTAQGVPLPVYRPPLSTS